MAPTKSKTRPKTMVFPPELFRVADRRARAEVALSGAETRLELALSVNKDADDERARFAASGIDVDDLPTHKQVIEQGPGYGGARDISYYRHRRYSAERLAAMESDIDAARAAVDELRALEASIRAEGKTFDLDAECEKVGGRWYALQGVGINGRAYAQHEPIPLAEWASVPDRKRHQLRKHGRVGELPR